MQLHVFKIQLIHKNSTITLLIVKTRTSNIKNAPRALLYAMHNHKNGMSYLYIYIYIYLVLISQCAVSAEQAWLSNVCLSVGNEVLQMCKKLCIAITSSFPNQVHWFLVSWLKRMKLQSYKLPKYILAVTRLYSGFVKVSLENKTTPL